MGRSAEGTWAVWDLLWGQVQGRGEEHPGKAVGGVDRDGCRQAGARQWQGSPGQR